MGDKGDLVGRKIRGVGRLIGLNQGKLGEGQGMHIYLSVSKMVEAFVKLNATTFWLLLG